MHDCSATLLGIRKSVDYYKDDTFTVLAYIYTYYTLPKQNGCFSKVYWHLITTVAYTSVVILQI